MYNNIFGQLILNIDFDFEKSLKLRSVIIIISYEQFLSKYYRKSRTTTTPTAIPTTTTTTTATTKSSNLLSIVYIHLLRLRIYPSHFCGREDIDKGDKILLPASALNQLYHMISGRNKSPMIFCLQNSLIGKLTYCGVLEFVA